MTPARDGRNTRAFKQRLRPSAKPVLSTGSPDGPAGRASRKAHRSEVLREGVRLIQDRETQLAALDASIFRSVEDADNGRTKPAGDVFDRLEAKYQSLAKRSK
ncbi:ribbon-helix-helix domain-containing protein [Paraburkholderia gardini]|uniref:ribbon-helix-helix domain-containing protein n=1 Tax=Paraburkholderia gardini TaxID=2823469 RepID=UPI002B4B9E2F|nr:type II toxin-antitoxin system ParD family antitoxin [Paraburkholderia gardini]